jgi:polygalacturonase
MASRSLVAWTCLLAVLLLLLALGGAPAAEARPGPGFARRRGGLAPRRKPSTNAPAGESVFWATGGGDGAAAFKKAPGLSSVHRKVAAGSNNKPPKAAPTQESGGTISVESLGAAGDGRSDDTKAFQKAWDRACSSAQPAVVVVPAGKKYLVKETPLSGPCKSEVTFQIDGTLVAPEDKSDWNKLGYPHWISLTDVDRLTVTGKGTLDGTGRSSWKNSCRVNHKKPCTMAPAALTFTSCNHLKVQDINLLNSPQVHLLIQNCKDVEVTGITITAPSSSPEADGIHVSHTEDIRIIKPVIKSGDDCISIATGVKNLYAYKVECGPGHGISIGSLGNQNSEAQVSDVTIDTAHVTGTLYGARIKTWQGGSGYARDIKFLNMVMDKVKHPIFIDQYYCNQQDPSNPKPCEEQKSAVQISNVLFKNIRGSGTTKDVISLHCSKASPCRDVVLQDVDLKMRSGGGKKTMSSCENVMLAESTGNVSPVPCTSVAAKHDQVPEEMVDD